MIKTLISFILLLTIIFSGQAFAGLKTKAFIAGGAVAVKHAVKSPALRKQIVEKAKADTIFRKKAKDILVKFWKDPKNNKFKDDAKSLYNEIIEVPRKINNRKPINSAYAGKVFKLDRNNPNFIKLSKAKQRELIKVQNKYPDGVPFNLQGFPDFSRYAIKKVDIKYTGSRGKDFDAANKAAKLKTTPDNYTWHHHENKTTMQLVPTDLHDLVKHTGGFAK